MSDEQSQLAPVDEFLTEIQTDLVNSLETRIREFSAEQAENFPSVPELGAITKPLWEELQKDFNNCELKDWSAHCEEIALALTNPPFTILWHSCKPEIKAKFWDYLLKTFIDTGKVFKPGQATTFSKITDIIAKFESSEMNPTEQQSKKENLAALKDENLFLKCTIRGQDFVLPVMNVVEIQQLRKLTQLPETQIKITGLLSSRGEMLPIFSLHELEEISPDTKNFKYFVVCEEKGNKYGFAVDSTDQVIRLDRSKFQPASAMSGFKKTTTYIHHSIILDEKILLVLEPEKIAS